MTDRVSDSPQPPGDPSSRPSSYAARRDRIYRSQEAIYERVVQDAEKRKVSETWLRDDSADAWLHRRMFLCLDPLLAHHPDSHWLTIGDGRYGKDAHYIQEKNLRVMATDISDVLLREAHEQGFIQEYRKENAEALSFADDSFDFVFCKEAYHHFPRPMIALYEMLRVARQGVMLIEPDDSPVLLHPRAVLIKLAKALLIRGGFRRLFRSNDTGVIVFPDPSHEEGGNFVYGLSRREIWKAAMALDLPHVAFKEMNTYYLKGAEFEPADDRSEVFRKMKTAIERRDRRCRRGLSLAAHDILIAIVFKTPVDTDLRKRLTADGYRVEDLPRNPYLQTACPDG